MVQMDPGEAAELGELLEMQLVKPLEGPGPTNVWRRVPDRMVTQPQKTAETEG